MYMNWIYKYSNIWVWPALVLVIHLFATIFRIYYTVLWFDSPMHLIGGMSIALAAHNFLRHDRSKLTVIVYCTHIIGTTAIASIAWELIEFGLDYISYAHHQPSIGDTMKDLWMGLSGAALITLYLIKTKARD